MKECHYLFSDASKHFVSYPVAQRDAAIADMAKKAVPGIDKPDYSPPVKKSKKKVGEN